MDVSTSDVPYVTLEKDAEETSNDQDSFDSGRPLFIAGLAVLLMQYTTSTLLSSFFPKSPQGQDFSEPVIGVIFSSFAVGTALFAPAVGLASSRVGLRNVVLLGLAAMAIFGALFGLSPLLASAVPFRCTLFIIFNFLAGGLSGCAEVGMFTLLCERFPERQASIVGAGEVMTGLGSTVGPFVGGLVYDCFSTFSPNLQFAVPFVLGACPVFFALLPVLWKVLPDAAVPADDETEQTGVFNVKTVLLLGANFMASAAWCSMDPTLEIKLTTLPFTFSATEVGVFFLLEGLVYTVLALPMGWIADKRPLWSVPLIFGGLCCFGAGFALLAPFKFGRIELPFLNNAYAAAGGLILIVHVPHGSAA